MQNNKPTVFQFNTNALPNRKKTIEIELEQINSQLSSGIYSLEIESNTEYKSQFFIIIQQTKLFSKISENQLLIWTPYSSSKSPLDDQLLTIYDDLFEVIIATNTDSVGVKIIEPFLYGRENSNYWIEYGKPGDQFYSLLYSGWQANGDEIGIDQDASIFASDIESFFISDQNIYQPGDTIHFYTVLRSFINDEFIIPDVNSYQFFLRKIDSGFTISEQEIVMSEFGTLNGELQIPENLTDGLYELGFDSDFNLSKQIYIDKRSINQLNFSVNFNSDDYKIGNDLSFIIETLSNSKIETDGTPIKWSIEFVSIEDSLESSDVFYSTPILNQTNILKDGYR